MNSNGFECRLMAQLLRRANPGHGITVHGLEVMGSEPGWDALRLHSPSF